MLPQDSDQEAEEFFRFLQKKKVDAVHAQKVASYV